MYDMLELERWKVEVDVAVVVGGAGPEPLADGDDGGLHDVVVIHSCIQTVKRALVHTHLISKEVTAELFYV